MVAEATGNLRMVVQQMWRILVLVLRLCGLKWQCVTKPPVVMAVVSAAGRTTMTMDRAVAAVDRMKLLSHTLPQQETKGEELTRKRRSDLHPLLLLLPRPRLRMLRNKKRNVKLQAAKKKTSWLKKSKSFVNPWNSIRKPRLRSRPVTVGCSWRRRDSHIWRLFALSFMRGSLPNWLMWRLFTPGQMWKSSCRLRLFLCWKSICRPGASPMTSLAGRRLPSPRLFPSFEMLFRAEAEGSGTMWWFLWRWFAHAGFWCGLTRAHWPVRCCRKPFLVGTDGWMLHGPCRFESGVSRHWLIRLLAATYYNSWVEWV